MAQLSLFAGKKQRGIKPAPPKEFYLQCTVADILNRWATRGWRFTHLPFGEFRDRRLNKVGQWYSPAGLRLKRMGTKPGWPDFILLSPYPSRTHFLELKRRGESLSEPQQEFQWFCVANEIPYCVADNLDDAVAQLKDWGAVRSMKVV